MKTPTKPSTRGNEGVIKLSLFSATVPRSIPSGKRCSVLGTQM